MICRRICLWWRKNRHHMGIEKNINSVILDEENAMVMKYILIRKNVKENTMYLSSVFRSELGYIFSNLSKDSFELDLEGNTYTLNYRFSNKKNDVYHLYMEFQTSPAKEAEVWKK